LSIQGDDIVERDLRTGPDVELGLPARYVLGLIGVDASVEDDDWLTKLVRKFGGRFPSTAEFSAFARTSLPGADFLGDPDGALVRWLELEELLFYTYERHLISDRLQMGFSANGIAD